MQKRAKTCISNIFGPNSKTCTCEVCAAWSRVSRGPTAVFLTSKSLARKCVLPAVTLENSIFQNAVGCLPLGLPAMPCSFNDAPTEIPQHFTNSTGTYSKKIIWCFLGNYWGHFHLYFSSITRSPKGQNMRYHRWENFSDWMGAKIKDALASVRTTFLIWMLILQH